MAIRNVILCSWKKEEWRHSKHEPNDHSERRPSASPLVKYNQKNGAAAEEEFRILHHMSWVVCRTEISFATPSCRVHPVLLCIVNNIMCSNGFYIEE